MNKNSFRLFIENIPIYWPLRNNLNKSRQKIELGRWEINGKPLPPPHFFKQHVLRTLAKEYNLRIFIETGTYYGDMVEALKDVFEKIYSIELSTRLYQIAKRLFNSFSHIEIICGDSGEVLKPLVKAINQPALFWLDGHYSGGQTSLGKKKTPICEELGQILPSMDLGHVIIIDDARLFGKDSGYPTTYELKQLIDRTGKGLQISIRDDSIRIMPING